MRVQANQALGSLLQRKADQYVALGVPASEVQQCLDDLSVLTSSPLLSGAYSVPEPRDIDLGEAQMSFPGRQSADLRQAQRIARPDLIVLANWQSSLLMTAIGALPGIGSAIGGLRESVSEAPLSVGIGPAISGGLIVGVSAGLGIVFNDREVGVYGSLSAAAGALASISATIQLTFIKGGLSNFRGDCNAIAINAGLVVLTGGVAILLTADEGKQFLGVSFQAGLGVGSPIEVFYMADRTWVWPLNNQVSTPQLIK